MFDFDTPVDRRHTDSHKWQKYASRDILPMWVADMDFQSPPAVIKAIRQRANHGVFGYGRPDPMLKTIIVEHLYQSYGWTVSPEWIIWLPGLVTGINVACRSVGRRGDAVLTTVPVYPPFLTAPRLASKKLLTSQMLYDGRQWQLDWDTLQAAAIPRTALFLLCNPHNPTGRVFTHKELEFLADICLQADMVVCSDEIHCDLVLSRTRRHIPFASLDHAVAERTITLMAPSKTYNIPGLGCAFAVIAGPALRRRFKKAMEGIVPHVNLFGFVAARAAYTHGKPWLEAMLEYLRGNYELVAASVNQMPGLHMGPVEGTYLAWIDTRNSGITNPTLFFEKFGVGVSDGTGFGGSGFIRFNFACPRNLLREALDRMARALANHPSDTQRDGPENDFGVP